MDLPGAHGHLAVLLPGACTEVDEEALEVGALRIVMLVRVHDALALGGVPAVAQEFVQLGAPAVAHREAALDLEVAALRGVASTLVEGGHADRWALVGEVR